MGTAPKEARMVRKKDDGKHARDLQLGSGARLRSFVLLALTIAGLYVCFLLLMPFLFIFLMNSPPDPLSTS